MSNISENGTTGSALYAGSESDPVAGLSVSATDLPLFSRLLEKGVEVIKMGDAIRFDIPPDKEMLIYTYGVGGCTASFQYADTVDARHVIFTHFPQQQAKEHARKLKQLFKQDPRLRPEQVQSVVLTLNPNNDKVVETLRDKIKPGSMEIVDYRGQWTSRRDQGYMMLYVPQRGMGEARYETWFNNGVLDRVDLPLVQFPETRRPRRFSLPFGLTRKKGA